MSCLAIAEQPQDLIHDHLFTTALTLESAILEQAIDMHDLQDDRYDIANLNAVIGVCQSARVPIEATYLLLGQAFQHNRILEERWENNWYELDGLRSLRPSTERLMGMVNDQEDEIDQFKSSRDAQKQRVVRETGDRERAVRDSARALLDKDTAEATISRLKDELKDKQKSLAAKRKENQRLEQYMSKAGYRDLVETVKEVRKENKLLRKEIKQLKEDANEVDGMAEQEDN